MSDVSHTKIDEMEAIDGFFEGIKFHKAAAGLGVSSFGISVIDLAPGRMTTPSTPGPEGIRLLVIGATPGEPYATGGTL